VPIVPDDTMENWSIKVETEMQIDAMENTMKIKAEPEEGDIITSCIDVEEHPVNLEQSDTLICGLPAPDTETSDQEQPQDIGVQLF
jgi:hypothetical protein